MPEQKADKAHFFQQEWLEENLEDLYEEAPCGYLSTLPDGTIFKVNQTLLHWLGCAKEELVGKKKFQQLLSIGGQIFHETHHMPLLAMQGFVNELSYEMVTSTGGRLPVLVNAQQKKDADGKPLFNRVTVFDFSDRRKYEEELLRQKKKAEAATEAKELFLSTVTHEIRTPIQSILGVSDLLQKNAPRPDQAELLAALQFSSENLLALINDLLDLSKLNAGLDALVEKPFSLWALARDIASSLRPIAEKKGLELHLSLAEDLPDYFIGDHLKIGRVIVNLLGNAIKFTHKGHVRLHVEKAMHRDGKTGAAFSISDTGIGIAAEKVDSIFQAFTQANDTIHNLYGGTGLGITISQRLLAMYGSQLEVESELGKGSVFRFALMMPTSEAPVVTNQAHGEQPLSGIKLLLVEDSSSNIFIVTRYFKFWELDFDSADNGQKAVEMVAQNDYDIVLMDLNMPVMDGYEAARRIRQLPGKSRQVPIVAFSASPQELVADKLRAAGIDGMVSKPFRPSELYGVIKSLGASLHEDARVGAGPDALLEMDEINQIFEDDREALAEYFEALLDDLSTIRENFMTAAAAHDYRTFRDAVHKATSFVRIFKPLEFKTAVQCAKEIYQNEDWAKLPAAQLEIEQAMDGIMSFFKRKMSA